MVFVRAFNSTPHQPVTQPLFNRFYRLVSMRLRTSISLLQDKRETYEDEQNWEHGWFKHSGGLARKAEHTFLQSSLTGSGGCKAPIGAEARVCTTEASCGRDRTSGPWSHVVSLAGTVCASPAFHTSGNCWHCACSQSLFRETDQHYLVFCRLHALSPQRARKAASQRPWFPKTNTYRKPSSSPTIKSTNPPRQWYWFCLLWSFAVYHIK